MDASKTGPNRRRWLGLRSYEETDHSLFFGRDQDSEALLRMVRREVLTTVFAPSGTGKTSLLRAGLFPRLRKCGYLPVWIRLDHSGVVTDHWQYIREKLEHSAIAENLEISSITPPQTDPLDETFWEYLHRVELWDQNNDLITPVIVIDQFEEIFTIGSNRSETARFLLELADIVEKRIPKELRERLRTNQERLTIPIDTQTFRFVLSLRQDFVAQLDVMRKSMPAVMRNRYPLHQMTGPQALQAVMGPGEGIVAPDVGRRIVEIVGGTAAGEPDNSPRDLDNVLVEPNHLSLVCDELDQSRRRASEERITADHLEEQSQDILRRFYQESFHGLDPKAQVFVEENLLTASGFRKSQPLDDAEMQGLSSEALRQLVDRHVLRIDDRRDMSHVELTHDLLTGVVQESRDRRHEEEEKERLRSARSKERKRRQFFAGACAVLVTFLSVAIMLAIWASRAETIAAQNAESAQLSAVKAESSRQAAEQLLSFMTNDLYDKLRPIGRLDLLQVVALKAQKHLEKNDSTALSAESRLDQARTLNRIANVLLLRGYLHDAMDSQRQAIEILSNDDDTVPDQISLKTNPELAILILDYAETHAQWGNPAEALALLSTLRTHINESEATRSERELIIRKYLITGRVQFRLGRFSEAEESLEHGRGECRKLLNDVSDDESARRTLISQDAEFGRATAKLRVANADFPAAFRMIRNTLSDIGTLVEEAPGNQEWLLQKSSLLVELGELHLEVGDMIGARDKFIPTLLRAQRELAASPTDALVNNLNEIDFDTTENPQWRRLVVRLHRNLGRALLADYQNNKRDGGYTDGEGDVDSTWRRHFERALAVAEALPRNEISQLLIADICAEYGLLLASERELQAHHKVFQKARDVFDRELDVESTANPTISLAFAELCKNASIALDRSKLRVRNNWFSDSQTTFKKILMQVPGWVQVHESHADLLESHAEWLRLNEQISNAIELRHDALKDREVVHSIDPHVASQTRALAHAHWELGDFVRWSNPLNNVSQEVIDHFRSSQHLYESLAADDHWWVEDRLNCARSMYHAARLLKEDRRVDESFNALKQASELGSAKATLALIDFAQSNPGKWIVKSVADKQRMALRQEAKRLWLPCALRDKLINESDDFVNRSVFASVTVTGPAQGVDFNDSALAEEFRRLESERMLTIAPEVRRELEDWWSHLADNPHAEASLAELADQGLATRLNANTAPVRLQFPIRISEDRPTTIVGRECTLRWTYEGSQRDQRDFRLQVSTQSDFESEIILNEVVSGTSYRFVCGSKDRGLNNELYWRVRPERANRSTVSRLTKESWSDVGYFEIYETLVKRIETTGKLRIGLFEFDGDLLEWKPGEVEWTGFNGELINHMREYLETNIIKDASKPLQIEAYNHSWYGMFEAAGSAEVDCAISVITRTKERERRYGIRFSEPYFETRFALVSHVSDRIESIEALRKSKSKILVNEGFRGERVAHMLIRGTNEIQSLTYQKVDLLLDGVIQGKAGAAITDDAFVAHHLREFPEKAKSLHIVRLTEGDYQKAMSGVSATQVAALEAMAEDFGGAEYEQYAVALSPEADQLRGKINEAILSFRETIAREACERADIPPAERLYGEKQLPEDEMRLATVIPKSPNQRTGTRYVIGDTLTFRFFPILAGATHFHLQIATSPEFSPLTIVKTASDSHDTFTFSDLDGVIPEGKLFWRAKATAGPNDPYPHRGWCQPVNFEFYSSCLSRIQLTNTIRTAVNLSNGQSVFRNDKGVFDGFDVRLMEMLADDLAEKLEIKDLSVAFVEMNFSEIFPNVSSRNVDMAISGITATREREAKHKIKFSETYCQTCQAAIWTQASAIEGPRDLKGRHFIVSGRTRAFQVARAISPLEKIQMIRFDDRTARWGAAPKAYLLEQLISQHAEVAVMDYPTALDAVARQQNRKDFVVHPLRNGNLPPDVKVDTEDNYAIALPSGQPGLLEKVNACLNTWKTMDDRPLPKIFSRYQSNTTEPIFELK